jgi:hypothetical protein
MTTRTFAFAPLSAILIAIFLTVLNPSAVAATNVAITNFQGAWVASATYSPGAVVTYSGASYICLVQNTHAAPTTHPHEWVIMDAAGATGATGPQGPQGPQGATGATGLSGGIALRDSTGAPVGQYMALPGPVGAIGSSATISDYGLLNMPSGLIFAPIAISGSTASIYSASYYFTDGACATTAYVYAPVSPNNGHVPVAVGLDSSGSNLVVPTSGGAYLAVYSFGVPGLYCIPENGNTFLLYTSTTVSLAGFPTVYSIR